MNVKYLKTLNTLKAKQVKLESRVIRKTNTNRLDFNTTSITN